MAVGSIPAQAMTVGQSVTVDVTPFFRDPDGGTLAYSAASSATAVLTVSLAGSNLTLTAAAAGTATVTVTATDPDGLSATQSAEVTVSAPNRAPEAVGTIPAQTLAVGQAATVDVASFFSDPDGDELAYAAESANAGVATASMSGSNLTVTAIAPGTATVRVTATDPDGFSARQGTRVTVTAANRAPVPVGAIPAQTMSVGGTVELDVSAFFADPDGDELSYAVESSAAGVVSAALSGSTLTLAAVALGTATVTATATDPGGLAATQSAGVTVTAANRAPVPVGAIPARTMLVGATVELDVSAFFADPDGDELSYAVESSDAGVVSAALSGSTLTLAAVALGTATVTATATDPGGLAATQSAGVTVAGAGGFRDDFDSAASLDDWNVRNADAAVADGILSLTPTTDNRLGLAEREVDPVLTDWTIRTRMGRAEFAGTVRMYWFTGHPRFQVFGVSLGPQEGRNLLFLFWDQNDEAWFFDAQLSGTFDAVRDGGGEFTDVTVAWDGQLHLTVEDTEVWSFQPTLSAAFENVTDIWLAGTGAEQRFDWFSLTGAETSGISEMTETALTAETVRDLVLRGGGATERRLGGTVNKR